ncbi:MAG: CHAP domain-containing protein [Rhodospirillales bacterium]|nr:CHAP domain-containing protein [Rhodospirillales bacterium]
MPLLLTACAFGPSSTPLRSGESYHPGLQCAPFANQLSGIALYGDAGTWWRKAAGRYRRSHRPEVGAVLVMGRQRRLPDGHVAVVSRLVDARHLDVMQANWEPGVVDRDQLVVDVSPGNDWTRVRVWWPPAHSMGITTYAAYGFILPPAAATHAQLARAVDIAARLGMVTVGRPPPRARQLAGG